jgi:hypothetical protein
MMCGVHCINALLQGPYFDEVTMSNIALSLDQKEKDIMAESGLSSKEYLKYMQVGLTFSLNDHFRRGQVMWQMMATILYRSSKRL